jgi:MSHA biogenesis protein MshN
VSLINKMLRDLDRRHAPSAAESEVPPAQVRVVAPARADREWFWRIFAGLMVVAVAWVLWIAYQLQPKPLVTDAAFRAAESARRSPPAPAAAAEKEEDESEEETAPGSPPMATFRLAEEISTPIRGAARGAAPPRDKPQAQQPAPPRLAAAEPSPAAKAPAPAPPRSLGLDVPPARIIQESAPARVQKRDRVRSPAERAEAEFRRAVTLLNQGRVSEAEEGLAAALSAHAAHEPARQALIALLLEKRQTDDARRLLQEGLAINPRQVQFALVLARILVERRDYESALEVLERAREGVPGSAELLAMRATALQRLGRHQEAVEAYEAAVRAAPQVGAAWLGLALSLDALDRRPQAAEAYRRAATSGNLSAEVRDYAERRARALQ